MKLYNNGYLVKALFDSPYEMFLPENKKFKGISRHFSWPLENRDDAKSQELTKHIEEKYFFYENIDFWLIPEKKVLLDYINHCKKLGIEVSVLKIETKSNIRVAQEELDISEVLGFDLADSVTFSYLSYDIDCCDGISDIPELELLKSRMRLNNNMLFDSYGDALKYLNLRNDLVAKGLDLESEDEIHIVRISVVVTNEDTGI